MSQLKSLDENIANLAAKDDKKKAAASDDTKKAASSDSTSKPASTSSNSGDKTSKTTKSTDDSKSTKNTSDNSEHGEKKEHHSGRNKETIGGIAAGIVLAGVGAFFWKKKQSAANEGGQVDDMYAKFLNEELA